MMTARLGVFDESLLEFFAPIRAYLDDPTVTEVMINGPDKIFVERSGCITRTTSTFPNPRALVAALRNAAQFVGKSVDEANPVLEGRLPDGSRLAAVLPPAGPGGPYVSIRRFFKEKLTMDRLIELGAITQDACDLLSVLVKCKQNILIAGGTGSGKTSLLNAVSAYIPEDERVVVISTAHGLKFTEFKTRYHQDALGFPSAHSNHPVQMDADPDTVVARLHEILD